MAYYECDDNDRCKSELYHRALKEIRSIKSDKYLKKLEKEINEIYDNMLERLRIQLPALSKDISWIALLVAGFQPRSIGFLLDIKRGTLYTKRLRVRSYIEKSDATDREEFLRYFPPTK